MAMVYWTADNEQLEVRDCIVTEVTSRDTILDLVNNASEQQKKFF
jgi:hypothetical protein